MPRIARVVAVCYPHHVTQRGNNREWVFLDDEDKTFYLSALERYSKKYNLRLWAYCLMNNHVHHREVSRVFSTGFKSLLSPFAALQKNISDDQHRVDKKGFSEFSLEQGVCAE